MANNLNCAELGYNCVFSITAQEGQEDFMIDTVEHHAKEFHPELVDKNYILKPDVKSKLQELLNQSKYTDLPILK